MFHIELRGYTVNGGVLASTDKADEVRTLKEQVLDDLMDRGFIVVETGTPAGFVIGKRRGDGQGLSPVGRVFVAQE